MRKKHASPPHATNTKKKAENRLFTCTPRNRQLVWSKGTCLLEFKRQERSFRLSHILHGRRYTLNFAVFMETSRLCNICQISNGNSLPSLTHRPISLQLILRSSSQIKSNVFFRHKSG